MHVCHPLQEIYLGPCLNLRQHIYVAIFVDGQDHALSCLVRLLKVHAQSKLAVGIVQWNESILMFVCLLLLCV